MQSHTITGGGGIQLYAEETGNPTVRPILFIHGFSQCRLSWGKQLAAEQHAAAIPHAQTSRCPNTGHAPFFEETPRFNRELRAFTESL